MTIADIHEVSIAKVYKQIFSHSWQVGARDVMHKHAAITPYPFLHYLAHVNSLWI